VPLRIGLLPLEDVEAPGITACPDGMVTVPGGTFRMGERKDTVTVATFCMDANEVTVARYAACVSARRCSAEHLREVAFDASFRPSDDCNYGVVGREDHPVNCVDWTQASAFCAAQNARLPSEEEWEWAARGGARGTTYPWGNDAPDKQLCWQGEGKSRRRSTCPVGSFPAGDGPFGIHDLGGNVLEWTQSEYNPYARVHRGGYWGGTDPASVRAAERGYGPPSLRTAGLGFRCARGLSGVRSL
jgi:formylglycine-generating enzyme required for sulfatase activity